MFENQILASFRRDDKILKFNQKDSRQVGIVFDIYYYGIILLYYTNIC